VEEIRLGRFSDLLIFTVPEHLSRSARGRGAEGFTSRGWNRGRNGSAPPSSEMLAGDRLAMFVSNLPAHHLS
jgi:hypothetical protein